ncbi:MAG: hypothetical protein NC907_06200 [Candidatus Omnitrophica bacterium]|nr:hypothetical protein [Candidatus Omnitrophota bacterium]
MVKLPLKIIKKDSKYKAITSIQELQSGVKNVRKNLTYIEDDYEILITTIRRILELLSKEKSGRIDARFYWLIGDYIISFLNRIDSLGYYIPEQNATIGKCTGVSETTIYRIVSLRKKIGNLSFIDPDIPWTKYLGKKHVENSL